VLAAILVVGAAAFICGVIVPMLDPSAPHAFSAYVPIAAYVALLATGARLLIRRVM
jgi:hypothetical protein